jgi:hypothetical protein
MSKFKSKVGSLTAGSILFTAAIAVSSVMSGAVNAQTTVSQLGQDPLVQKTDVNAQNVTSVSQLSDVQPTDWAFTALQSLVERYGCIAGYPDRTFRGNRATSRYEFAAGLNACLDKINELISSGLADKVSKEDLAALQKLQEEFAAELATLRGRVDALEAKTAQLEAQQFSTTTKLNATAIIAASGATDNNFTLAGRVRINFDTSFTGKDRLRTRLEAGNIQNFTSFKGPNGTTYGTNMARLGFISSGAQDNTFNLTKLIYSFPVANIGKAWVGTTGLSIDDVFLTGNPYFESSDFGSVSRFGRYDPLIMRGSEGAGAAFSFSPAKEFSLTGLYLASDATASNPTGQGGLTNGAYSAGVQLAYTPSKEIIVALEYLRSFEPGSLVNLTSSTGSVNASRPFGRNDTSANRYGVQLNWRVAKWLAIGGSVGFVNARQESAAANAQNQIGRTADLLTYQVNLAFLDLFGEGNVGGIIFGQQPRIQSASAGVATDSGTSYHLEGLYRFRISKNISITPGVFVIFNPEHNSANSSVVVGTIRTTFQF